MKVTFSRTGGFAPIPFGCVLDGDTMPPGDATRLKELVQSTQVMSARNAEVKGARDVYYYTIKVELDGKQHKVRFDQLSVPPEIKPLLDFLLARSKRTEED